MAICYELRFPQMFSRYAQAGASDVFVPSAFTIRIGKARWKTLLKARAIENGLWAA
jgi:predicted amidohydrolase